MKRCKILAVDYGAKNVGLACCDELAVAIRPLASLPNQGKRDLLQRIKQAISENAIEKILVGLPLNMDGTQGEAAEGVSRFLSSLRTELKLPIVLVDERLSTVEAQELWRAMNRRQQRKYRTIDSLAAAMILRRFLEDT